MPSLIPTRRLTQPLGRVSRAKPRADDGSCWTSPTPISAGSAQGHAPVDIPSVPPRTAVDASTGDRRGWNAEQCLQRQPIHISQHTQSIGLQPTMSRGWDGNARAAPNIKVHWRGQPGVRDYTAACQSGDTIVLQHCPDLDCHSGSCALAANPAAHQPLWPRHHALNCLHVTRISLLADVLDDKASIMHNQKLTTSAQQWQWLAYQQSDLT